MIINPRFQAYATAPLALLAILLFGHYGLFLGHTFLADEDALNVFMQLSGNRESMGWRPDLGLGISHFYADPGSGHVWSLWRWWYHLFTDQIFAFNVSVFVALWAMSLSLYLLLKKVFPEFNLVTLVCLAALIGFGSLRHESFFPLVNSLQTIATPIVTLIILDHLQKPSARQYFLYSLTLFFTLFLGNTIALIYVLIYSVIFFSGYIFYHRKTLGKKKIWEKLIRFITLQFLSGITLVFLGAWIFYSVLFESQIMDNVRDPVYSASTFFAPWSLESFFQRIFALFHAGYISPSNGVLGVQQFLTNHSWFNVVPIFPLILIFFLSSKSRVFWEFFAKFIVILSIVYILIMAWIPGIPNYIQSITSLNPLVKFYTFFQPFQIVLIGFLIKQIGSHKNIWEPKKQKWLVLTAFLLSFFYACLLALAIASQLMPQLLAHILVKILTWLSSLFTSPATGQIIANIVKGNILLFGENMSFPYVLFYGTTLGFMVLFATQKWIEIIKWRNGIPFVVLLLFNNIFLSWSVYPMGKEKLIWNQQELNGIHLSKIFKTTDRVALIGIKRCRSSKDYFKCIQKKFLDTPFGARRHLVGYYNSPAFNFSVGKRFTPKPQVLHLESILKREEIYLEGRFDGQGGMREVFGSHQSNRLSSLPSFYDSKIFDLTSVNYFLSTDPLPKSEHLESVHASKQFFLYRNKEAWPYFYLAEKIQTYNNLGDLYDAQQGTAYLRENNVSVAPFPQQQQLKLLEFKYGDLKFQYSSEGNAFLVIQDTWHPSWRARVDDIETKVFKTNGSFKGILLPPGQGTVHLFFDYSQYLPGIWISLVSWIFFMSGWKLKKEHFRETY